MKRLHTALAASCLALAVTIPLSAATTTLTFNAAVPGTLNDTNGLGTGFTVRIPGSGSAIPANDPNLTLDTANDRLLVGSTRSSFADNGFGRNLAGMEAPAILLSGVGGRDFEVQAHFLDLHVDQSSDQIGVFVGGSVDNLVRGGVFEDIPDHGYQAGFNYSQNGFDSPPNNTVLDEFQPGQEGIFDIGRTGGVWHFRWQDITNPINSGSFENILLPNLNALNDLYVGIFNHDARNFTPQTATLESFTVTPEPSSVVLFGVGALSLVLVARRRSRRSPE